MADQKEDKKEPKGKPQPKRKAAPRMNVRTVTVDERTELVNKLEKQDPECKYIFQAASITDEELAAKGMERTEHKLGNDILCRTVKESYEEWIAAGNRFATEQMETVDNGSGQVQALDASPKKPKS